MLNNVRLNSIRKKCINSVNYNAFNNYEWLCCSKIKDTEIVCEPCSNENVQTTATHFCKTCEDPEPLCDICAKQHIRQKISKAHKLCSDIQKFPKHQPPPSWYVKTCIGRFEVILYYIKFVLIIVHKIKIEISNSDC